MGSGASGHDLGAGGAKTYDIVNAVRLGWSVAEVRGRHRIGDNPTRLGLPAFAKPLRRFENALPLMSERSEAEQRIEAERVLKALAKVARVDVPCSALTGQPETVATQCATDRLTCLAMALSEAKPGEEKDAWIHLTNFFYGWDAVIQDTLACRDFGTSSAYQLGRGLAEIFWAFDASAPPDDARSAAVLLGPNRVGQLKDLLDRLAHHFPPLSSSAVEFSLEQWAAAAARRQVTDSRDTYQLLAHQGTVWRDMLLTAKDPKLYLKATTLLDRAGQLREVARRFIPEISLLAVGTGVLSTGAALLTTGGAPHALGAALAVLGAAGISVSGVAAKLKDAANNLLQQLRNELYEAAVAEATCFAPRLPQAASVPPLAPPSPIHPAPSA